MTFIIIPNTYTHFSADAVGCWTGFLASKQQASLESEDFISSHIISVLCYFNANIYFPLHSNKIVPLAMRLFYLYFSTAQRNHAGTVEIRFRKSKWTNDEARHLPHRISGHLLETSENKRVALRKTAFFFLKGNLLNLLTDQMIIIKCNTVETWSS